MSRAQYRMIMPWVRISLFTLSRASSLFFLFSNSPLLFDSFTLPEYFPCSFHTRVLWRNCFLSMSAYVRVSSAHITCSSPREQLTNSLTYTSYFKPRLMHLLGHDTVIIWDTRASQYGNRSRTNCSTRVYIHAAPQKY